MSAPADTTHRILVVEDDPYLAAGLVENLRAEGYTVDQAGDGRVALEQILARDDLAGPLGQHLEDHRLLLGEFLGEAVPRTAAEGTEVDLVLAEAQHRGLGRRALVPVPAPENGPHAQQQLLEMEGLGQVVVAAGLQTPYPVGGIAARGQKQHRRVVAALAQCAADGEPVDLRQHDIEQYQAVGLRGEPLQSGAPVAGLIDRVAFGAQVLDQSGGEVRIILDHEDPVGAVGRRAHDRLPSSGCLSGRVVSLGGACFASVSGWLPSGAGPASAVQDGSR